MLTLRKRGKFWHARGSVPMRQPDGRIARIRIEESTRKTAKARARRVADDIEQEYHDQAYRPKQKSISFTDAALTYVETKNPSKRDKAFAAKLVAHFGETPIDEIDQAAISGAAHALYPGKSASTHNRAVFAPASIILRLAGRRMDIKRPRVDRRPLSIPGDEWFAALLPHCSDRLAALVIFLTLTGRRITEALQAVDNGDGTCTVAKTKSGRPVMVDIPSLVLDFLGGQGNSIAGQRLFTYGDRHNVYRELRKACERAGVLVRDEKGNVVGGWYGSHAIGRHSYCTRLLREGFSTKFVAEAAGHESTRMVDLHYGHLAKSEVRDQADAVGESWGKRLAERQKKAGNKD